MSKKIVYIDGVFDMFHRGHLESLRQAKNIFNDPDNTFLIVGVVSDIDCISYKRRPIINENDRNEIIKNIKFVDMVIFPCPLYYSINFINMYNIDLVVHSFSNEEDRNKQYKYFEQIIKINKFKEIDYYNQISTTQLINQLKEK